MQNNMENEDWRGDSFDFSLADLVTFASRPTEFSGNNSGRLIKNELERLYRVWLGRKICDAFPNEATRQMIDVKITNPDKSKISDTLKVVKAVEKRLQNLEMMRKLNQALILANVYGGSAIVILLDDGIPYSEPINPKKVKRIVGLEVLDRYKIKPFVQGELPDPLRPSKYRLIPSDEIRRVQKQNAGQIQANTDLLIDSSRVLRFDGVPLPPDLMRANDYWGDSILFSVKQEIIDYLRVYEKASDFIANPTPFIHKVDKFRELIATTGKAKVKEYLKLIHEAKGTLGGFVLDKNDDFVYANRTFAELANLLDRYGNKLVAASGIPYSILFGKGAEGLAAGGTGETEKGIFYQNVMQYQELVLRPAIEAVLTLVFLEKDGATAGVVPDDWHMEFKPLEQPSLKDELTAKQMQSQIDSTYLQYQVLQPQEVRSSRFGRAEFSYDILLTEEKLQADPAQQQLSGAPTTPPPEVIAQLKQQLQSVDDETLLKLAQNPQLQPFEVELLQAEIARRQAEAPRSRSINNENPEDKKDSIQDLDEDDYLDDIQKQAVKYLDQPYDHVIRIIKSRIADLPPNLSEAEMLDAIDSIYTELPLDTIAEAMKQQMLISALSQRM